MPERTLILASASPRRRELLTQAGITFTVEPADVDETPRENEVAGEYVERVAIEKAQAVAGRHRGEAGTVVLAADTAVVLADGTILGKPANVVDAKRMLEALAGRTHTVMTGLCAMAPDSGRFVSAVELTQVSFNLILPEEMERYIASGEPMDKAGSYAIQGYASRWIPRIEGDYCNVVGLPIARTLALLDELAATPAATL